MTADQSTRLTPAQSADTAREETDGGAGLDAADLRAERRLAERAGLVPARLSTIQGTVITHRGTTEGSAPEHADDRTVRAALADAGNIVRARIGDTFDPDGDDAKTVRGILIAPRTGYDGHAQVWFLEGGKPEQPRYSVALGNIADTLHAAGWIVSDGGPALDIQATELVWRADNGRRTAWDIYPAAHHFQLVTGGNDAGAVHGWTFTTLQAGTYRFGWADGRLGMSGRLWDTRQLAAQALTGHKEAVQAPAAFPAATVPTAPETGARLYQSPTSAQVWEIAALLVGEGVTLSLDVLAAVADGRAVWQDDKGGQSAASRYRECAHHLRQAAATLTRAEDGTDEERAATADMAGAHVEAATTHAHEADLTAI